MEKEFDEQPMTSKQLADFLQVTTQTISNYMKDPNFPYKKVGGENRFYKSKVMKYFSGNDNDSSIAHPIDFFNDKRILKMNDVLGSKSYGIYWVIMEYLSCEIENKLEVNYIKLKDRINLLSPNDLIDEKYIKSMINDFDLFEFKDGYFLSKDLMFMEKNK